MVGPVVAGFLFDYTDDYVWSGVFASIPILLGCIPLVMMMDIKRKTGARYNLLNGRVEKLLPENNKDKETESLLESVVKDA